MDGKSRARAGRARIHASQAAIVLLLLSHEASLFGQPAGPQSAAAPRTLLTLPEAERLALEASPALQQAGARVRMKEGRLRQVGLYPDPELSLEANRFTNGLGPKETAVSIRQRIPYHGKRALEKEEAVERVEAARSDLERQRLDILLEVREAYVRIHFASRVLKVEEEDLEATQAIRRAVEARVAAGDAAPFEALKASVEVSRAENQVDRIRGEVTSQAASFNLLLGLPAERPTAVAEPGLDLEPQGDPASLVARALERQPEIKAREQEARAAALAAQRARLEPRPDLAVGPIVRAGEGESFVGLGLSLRLPAWNRNRGNVVAAEADRDAAQATTETVRLAISRLVAESYGGYRAARARQLLFEQGLLARANELADAARKSYQGGESGLLDLLDARRTLLAVREEYYRASLDAALLGLRLRRALGEEPSAPAEQSGAAKEDRK